VCNARLDVTFKIVPQGRNDLDGDGDGDADGDVELGLLDASIGV
jgi:hypothetical protein